MLHTDRAVYLMTTSSLKLPSKWENCARNDLIWFFHDNNLATFE